MAETPDTVVVKIKTEWDEENLINLAAVLDRHTPMAIGRTVHYRSRGSADGKFDSRCVAAIVTQVHDLDSDSDQLLDLAVLNPRGLFFNGLTQDKVDFVGGTWHRLSDCPNA